MLKISCMRMSELANKVIISDESGRNFGKVSDVSFICDTGELMNVIVKDPTQMSHEMQLQQDEQGRLLIPFSAIKSVGDFVIVSEKEIF
ncbi:MAG: PRC-barrel domain-containing protein [Candidatus Aenigmarchaeota archaeon]|nr:PRC-barrel domain-containing protein [Candidatus Aenigmarchaeota archaeon]